MELLFEDHNLQHTVEIYLPAAERGFGKPGTVYSNPNTLMTLSSRVEAKEKDDINVKTLEQNHCLPSILRSFQDE